MMHVIETGSLTLEPQTAAHAEEMFAVLSDPAIYEHENEPPPTLEWLRARFAQLVGDGCPAGGINGCLNIADQLGARQADHPVEPLLLAVCRSPGFELREPGAQPLESGWRLVLTLVDRRVAEDGKHLFGVRRGLRLQCEAARLDDVHHFSSRICLAVFRSRTTHCASASNLA